jgi:hypothetical protein
MANNNIYSLDFLLVNANHIREQKLFGIGYLLLVTFGIITYILITKFTYFIILLFLFLLIPFFHLFFKYFYYIPLKTKNNYIIVPSLDIKRKILNNPIKLLIKDILKIEYDRSNQVIDIYLKNKNEYRFCVDDNDYNLKKLLLLKLNLN